MVEIDALCFQHRVAKARPHHFILIYGINGLLPTEVQGALGRLPVKIAWGTQMLARGINEIYLFLERMRFGRGTPIGVDLKPLTARKKKRSDLHNHSPHICSHIPCRLRPFRLRSPRAGINLRNYQLASGICEAVFLVSDDANQPVVERGRLVILTRHILNDNLPLRLTYTHSSSRNENTPARPDESKWVLRRVVPWRFGITVGNLTLLEVDVAGRTCGIRFIDRRFAALS